jgi:hypothetical protein
MLLYQMVPLMCPWYPKRVFQKLWAHLQILVVKKVPEAILGAGRMKHIRHGDQHPGFVYPVFYSV